MLTLVQVSASGLKCEKLEVVTIVLLGSSVGWIFPDNLVVSYNSIPCLRLHECQKCLITSPNFSYKWLKLVKPDYNSSPDLTTTLKFSGDLIAKPIFLVSTPGVLLGPALSRATPDCFECIIQWAPVE